jgi:C4-dicarboxylate-specific signal transduction histidine kinase
LPDPLEALRLECEQLRATLAEQVWLANLGVLASPVTHEFNNFLNVLLLQIAVLEHDLPEKRRGEFRSIRQQGKIVAELIRQWQQYRSRQPAPLEPLDLNQLVGETVEALCREEPGFGEAPLRMLPPGAEGPPGDGVWVQLVLGADVPPVLGTRPDLERLVRFLVGNGAAAVTSLRGLVVLTTTAADERVRLRVEDSGPAVAPELLPQLFEPLVTAREGPNRLELAACKTIAHRRLQGAIEAANRPEGGVAVEVALRTAR